MQYCNFFCGVFYEKTVLSFNNQEGFTYHYQCQSCKAIRSQFCEKEFSAKGLIEFFVPRGLCKKCDWILWECQLQHCIAPDPYPPCICDIEDPHCGEVHCGYCIECYCELVVPLVHGNNLGMDQEINDYDYEFVFE
jgi:hypothetical protein